MNGWRELLDGMGAIVRRDAILYFSYRKRVFAQLAIVTGNLTLFYYVSRLVESPRFPDPDTYFAFVVVGLVIVHVITATIASLPASIRQELVAGTFERFAVSALGPAAGIVAMTAFPVLSSMAIGVLTIAIAALVFGLEVAQSTAVLAVPVAFLAALALLPFSLLTATVMLLFKQVGALGSFIVIGLALAGGVYFPTALLPGWVAWVGEVQPLTPALELLRHVLTGAELRASAWAEVGRMLGFTAVFLPVSLMVLAGSIEQCRRRGTLTEY